jgi:N,N'-diacetyllegionaminate synthase
MLIGPVDLDREVLVVAEIGNNHEGSFARAEEMIACAAETGARAVKFQTFVPEHYVSREETARLERLRQFAFTFEQFEKLARFAESKGLIFLSTPFDLASARFLNTLCPAIKISSGDNNFVPLLELVATFNKPVLLSTGLADLSDVEKAHATITKIWNLRSHRSEVVLLHCVSSYPTPIDEANLGAIRTLRERFGGAVGYSDHTLGIDAAVLSVALGARIVEKHFTLDKNLSDFRDHQLSADPAELKELVMRVSVANKLIGDGKKRARPSEEQSRIDMRRSIAAGVDLAAGTVLRLEHLTWVRPGRGIAPGDENLLLGRVLKRALRQGELLSAQDVSEPTS